MTQNEWLPLAWGGRWVDAGELQIGDDILQADGTTGEVRSVRVVTVTQPMYNLTVDQAHTFFVGRGQWLVHNAGCAHWTTKLSEYEKIALDKAGHLEAAQRELAGEIVKLKPDGTPYDHVEEVRNIQNGLMNMITDIQKQLDGGKLDTKTRTQMEELLSRASRALDYSEKYVPR